MSLIELIDEPTTTGGGAPAPAAPEGASGPWGVNSRLILAASVLCAGVLVQFGLLLYVRAGGVPPPANLASPLKSLPPEIDKWQGEDIEITDRNSLYGNEHLKRKYVNRETRQEVLVWMVYSRVGVDRDHHPEICYAVQNRHEIAAQRRQLKPDEHEPIEVFCFGDESEKQTQNVYYWNYTLPMPEQEGLDVVRRTYHKMRTRPASVTAEVFAGDRTAKRTAEVDSLVAKLDLELQKIVGENARRGSERKPFTILKTEAEPQQE